MLKVKGYSPAWKRATPTQVRFNITPIQMGQKDRARQWATGTLNRANSGVKEYEGGTEQKLSGAIVRRMVGTRMVMAAEQFAVCFHQVRAGCFCGPFTVSLRRKKFSPLSLNSTSQRFRQTSFQGAASVTKTQNVLRSFAPRGGMLNNISAGGSVHGISGKFPVTKQGKTSFAPT